MVPKIRDCSLHPHWRFPAPLKDQGKGSNESSCARLGGGAAPQVHQAFHSCSLDQCQARSHLLLRLGAWSWPQTLFWNSFWLLLLSFLSGTHSAPGGCHRGILELWILAGSFSSEALGAFGAVCCLVVGVFWSVTTSTFPECFN